MNARRAAAGDESIVRDLRLRALTDAPDAFGSTYAREAARTPRDWRQWLATGATFIAEDQGALACGIVAGLRDPADAEVVQLMSMWVDPNHRGAGAGDALVAALDAWARLEGARVIRLDVIDGNVRARRFYERLGFQPTGRTRVRERDGCLEVEMERLLERV